MAKTTDHDQHAKELARAADKLGMTEFNRGYWFGYVTACIIVGIALLLTAG